MNVEAKKEGRQPAGGASVDPSDREELLHRLRHSAAHVMAQAVLERYPEAKVAIGPAIETGFYYDFDLGPDADGRPRTFLPEDLAAIEHRRQHALLRRQRRR